MGNLLIYDRNQNIVNELAEHSSPEGLYLLGNFYYNCENHDKAIKLYKKAAELGNSDARTRLNTIGKM
jgi:TPR repeat protein